MPVITKVESSFAIDPGQYILRLLSCDIVDGTNYRTQLPEDQLKWVWAIERVFELEPTEKQLEHVGEEAWEWTSPRFTPNSKGCARAEALLGRQMAINEEIDTDRLIGRRLKATYAPFTSPVTKNVSVRILAVQSYQETATKPAPIVTPVAETIDEAGVRASLKVAIERTVAAKKWALDDLKAMTKDIWGKTKTTDLTAQEAQVFLEILNEQHDVHYDQDGKFVLGLAF
jgi:hypothetical protein